MNATNTLCLFNLFVCKNFLLQWRTVLVKVVYRLQLRTNVTIVVCIHFTIIVSKAIENWYSLRKNMFTDYSGSCFVGHGQCMQNKGQ